MWVKAVPVDRGDGLVEVTVGVVVVHVVVKLIAVGFTEVTVELVVAQVVVKFMGVVVVPMVVTVIVSLVKIIVCIIYFQ